ncbi:DUF448 domain-containing protein [Aliarcobacter butzleri]|uniref:DUF448 domain-containing protein n=1 Tax=Aliarcobacter butzleri TaxID=28197 RepID=UPI00102D9B72|nr:DUF448 domain-containing protein [Aliarcobacter butzleri]MCG3659254.1 DUF448 domain-containing protein [Aliarcobacter butzleri]MDN5068852.1 DUF448 domain-containing protein [Aliarcobacter butzleri]MDN5099010.1 DUF448 domain-containing protein [Aliarcobacter butzleri]MDN5103714.1 DUF448 domain-containing protein [Aliarcobacter butzleri]RZV13459.1 DUF448 domain-containing protein [Aliarcobacter butzleri]
MANLKKILRTCIFCKGKFEQKELLRLKCKDKKLSLYDNLGRSFYICEACILKFQTMNEKDYKKYEKPLCKECKNKDEYVIQLKEILTDVRYSKSL